MCERETGFTFFPLRFHIQCGICLSVANLCSPMLSSSIHSIAHTTTSFFPRLKVFHGVCAPHFHYLFISSKPGCLFSSLLMNNAVNMGDGPSACWPSFFIHMGDGPSTCWPSFFIHIKRTAVFLDHTLILFLLTFFLRTWSIVSISVLASHTDVHARMRTHVHTHVHTHAVCTNYKESHFSTSFQHLASWSFE